MIRFAAFALTTLLAAAPAFGHGVDAGESGPLIPRSLPLSETQRAALGIEVDLVERVKTLRLSPLPGRITLPNAGIRVVSARHAGVVTNLSVAPGDRVGSGDRLATIESIEFVAAQRRFLDALAQHDLARATAERERELAGDGLVAERRRRASEAHLREMVAQLDERRQVLRLAGLTDSDIDRLEAKRRLAPTYAVASPTAGEILEQYVDPGQSVEAGGRLLRIGAREELFVDFHVPTETARHLGVGAEIVLAESGERGSVVSVRRAVRDGDPGVLVRARLVDPGDWAIGELVAVQIATPARSNMYRVSAQSVVRAEGRTWVFVTTEEGFYPHEVHVLGGTGGQLTIAADLAPDARIAVRGTVALKGVWSRGDSVAEAP